MLDTNRCHAQFEASSRAVLAFLSDRLDFGLWMTTRTDGDDWHVLQTEAKRYDVAEGAVFRWSDTLCYRMAKGLGPRIAPRAQDVPSYSDAPINEQVTIGAYIGVPIFNADGTLFGTMCAIDPQSQPESIREDLPLIELYAELLGKVLATEKTSIALGLLLQNCREEASTDDLTGVYNRKGWETRIREAEALAQRNGTQLSVMMIDLDNLKETNDSDGHRQGDLLLKSTANCLRSVMRDNDIIARLGGDEFAVLAIECDEKSSEAVFGKIVQALHQSGVQASVGKASHTARTGLDTAIVLADQDMYSAKSLKKNKS